MPKIEFEFRLFGVEADMAALKDYLDVVEQQIIFLREQRRIQVRAALIESGLADDRAEVDIAHQELRYDTEYVYPKTFRASFVVLLWAAYESAIAEAAEFLRRAQGKELRLSDIRAETPLVRANKYFDHVLGFPLHSAGSAAPILHDLYFLRNSFAHANGRLAIMTPAVRRRVEELIEQDRGVTEDFGSIVLEQHFIREGFNAVDEHARELVRRVREWDDDRRAGSGPQVG